MRKTTVSFRLIVSGSCQAFLRRASNSSASTLPLVRSGLKIRHLMNSDLFRRFSTKEGMDSWENVKTAHSRIPIKYLRGQFNVQSPRGATATLHHCDGNDRIFVHAWNEPGWKGGKAPKKAAKVIISNVFSAAPVVPCRRRGHASYLMELWSEEFLKFHKRILFGSISARQIASTFTISIGKEYWASSGHGGPRTGIYGFFRL